MKDRYCVAYDGVGHADDLPDRFSLLAALWHVCHASLFQHPSRRRPVNASTYTYYLTAGCLLSPGEVAGYEDEVRPAAAAAYGSVALAAHAIHVSGESPVVTSLDDDRLHWLCQCDVMPTSIGGEQQVARLPAIQTTSPAGTATTRCGGAVTDGNAPAWLSRHVVQDTCICTGPQQQGEFYLVVDDGGGGGSSDAQSAAGPVRIGHLDGGSSLSNSKDPSYGPVVPAPLAHDTTLHPRPIALQDAQLLPHEAHGVGVIVKALVQQNAGALLFLRTMVCVAALLCFAHSALVLGERPAQGISRVVMSF